MRKTNNAKELAKWKFWHDFNWSLNQARMSRRFSVSVTSWKTLTCLLCLEKCSRKKLCNHGEMTLHSYRNNQTSIVFIESKYIFLKFIVSFSSKGKSLQMLLWPNRNFLVKILIFLFYIKSLWEEIPSKVSYFHSFL